jgi:putative toxin-antitoxin system antitoxin component (TIGR02293 family)
MGESTENVASDRLTARAVRVLGDEVRAARWLRAPNPELRGRSPIELLDAEWGRREVEQLLARMERGAYS